MVITVGATMAAAACGGRAGTASGPASCPGTEFCNPQPVECPTTPPSPGEACSGEGTCTYETAYGCPGDMSCTGGEWTPVAGSCNPPAMPLDASVADVSTACPVEPPAAGTPCSGSANETCFYLGANGCPNDLACTDGQWTPLGGSCNPPGMPVDAAVVDASTGCPPEPPAGGTPCSGMANEMCSYQGANGCPNVLWCAGGHWEPAAVGCNPPAMPVDAAVVDASGE